MPNRNQGQPHPGRGAPEASGEWLLKNNVFQTGAMHNSTSHAPNKDALQRPQLLLDVLQQFRVIYGSMRQHFREVEQRCGLPGTQMWLLQEVQSNPGVGITALAVRLGIHQSTCSQLVEKLVEAGYVEKVKQKSDRRRIGLALCDKGIDALSKLPGPAEGILPAALDTLPDVALKTLQINLKELVDSLAHKDDAYAATPLADIVRQ